jgi:hypothetical protein
MQAALACENAQRNAKTLINLGQPTRTLKDDENRMATRCAVLLNRTAQASMNSGSRSLTTQ